MTEHTDTPTELIEHRTRVAFDVVAGGFDTATATQVADGVRALLADAVEAYDPVQPGADLWSTDPDHPAGIAVGKLTRVEQSTARPTDGPPPALTERLRDYCREFAIPTDDQGAHIDYLNGLILDALAETEASR